jgi:predicted ester cyclase
MAAADANKAMARRLYEEVFGRGNYDAADEIMAETCVSHGPGSPPSTGTSQIKRQAVLLRGAIPDLRVILHDQIAEGDRVASRWEGEGTFTGEFPGPAGPLASTGAAISFAEIRIDRFAGGRIVESWFIPDRMSLWQQLGLMD